jgi:hypothetical protein
MHAMNASSATATRAIPRRGLILALALSILAHLVALMAANSRFSFSFEGAQGTASLDTRMIIPAPLPNISNTPSDPTPIVSSAPPQRTSQPPVAKAPPVQTAPRAAIDPQSEKPESEKKEALPEQEKPLDPGVKSENNATDTVAISTMTAAETTATQAATPSGPTAPPGLKLQYPANAQLEFEGINMRKGEKRSGSGLLTWKSDGTSYEAALEASIIGISIFSQKSVGLLSPQGLAPERYSDKRFGKPEQATHFRRELGKIQFSNNKPEATLLVGAQDRLSTLVQLAGIIGGDQERYRIVNRIPMQVASTDAAELWEFMLEGVSDITVPAANMQALKLQRKPRDEFDQRLEIWLSPQLGYLPIRIKQSSATEPEQDYTDLVLKRLP